jgi:hypothetical protein
MTKKWHERLAIMASLFVVMGLKQIPSNLNIRFIEKVTEA